jgi:hypothetical protein
MAKTHAVRAISQAADAGELVAQQVAVLLAVASFGGDTLEPVFPSLAKIGSRAGGMKRRTVGRWLASLVAKGWLVRMHRFVHYSDPATSERKMRGTSCMWRLDVPACWLDVIRAAAQQSREQASKGRSTPKAPQNSPSTAGKTAGRPWGMSAPDWEREVEAGRVAAAAREAESLAKLNRQRAEVAAPPPPGLRDALRRPADDGPGP